MAAPAFDENSLDSTPSKRRPAVRAIKLTLAVVVLVAVGWHLWSRTGEWRQRRQAGEATLTVHAGWVVAGGCLYVCGLGLCGVFWGRLLADSDVLPGRSELFRAYFVGHLGKYIPGKAWVVLIRAGLLRRPEQSGVRVALTVVYETLTMMAVGAVVGAVALVVAAPERWWYWGGSALLAVILGGAVFPPTFRRLAGWVSIPFRRTGRDTTPQIEYSTLARGTFTLTAGWLLMGLSLVAVARAIGVEFASVRDPILLVGSTALATVAGFLVLFAPSGLGPRELIVTELLIPRLGPSAAVGASILLRLVWVVSELCIAGVLYWWPRRPAQNESAS